MLKDALSHDRLTLFSVRCDQRSLKHFLLGLITSTHEITGGQEIAIDGKTLRQSYDKAGSKSAIHMVGAWATQNQTSVVKW